MINPLVPELDVRDFAKSVHFYTEILGFEIQYGRDNPKFALLSYGEAQLMLSEVTPESWYAPDSTTPLGRGVNFQIRTTDLKGLVRRLVQHEYPIRRDIYESLRESWGEIIREIEIHLFDPDDYFLRFSELVERSGKLP